MSTAETFKRRYSYLSRDTKLRDNLFLLRVGIHKFSIIAFNFALNSKAKQHAMAYVFFWSFIVHYFILV